MNNSGVCEDVAASRLLAGEPVAPLAFSTEPPPYELADAAAATYRMGEDFYVPNATLRFVVEEDQLCEARPDGLLVGLLPLADGGFLHRSSWERVRFLEGPDGLVDGLAFGRFRGERAED